MLSSRERRTRRAGAARSGARTGARAAARASVSVALVAAAVVAFPAGTAAANPILPGIPGVPAPVPAPADPAAPAAPGAPRDPAAPAAPLAPEVQVPAAPEPPRTPEEARQRLNDVRHEAEALTEQWHAAADDLTAKQTEADRLREAVDPLRAAADQARGDEETYRETLDGVTLSFYENGRLDQFNALLASSSPQAYLDQMSALETLSADRLVVLADLTDKVDRAAHTQAEADDATLRARTAADDARRAADEIGTRKADAEKRIGEAEALLRQLSPAEIADLNGPAEDAPDILLGSGVGADALRAAATKLGRPYVWGASGPGSFDCSGLTSWAFKQAGITLPRSSSAQSRVGTPVSWSDMRPGDLVFYYSPVSHVGIYAGGGKMINAPQSGDVVKYQTVSRSAFTGARRL
ncbi:NlpC/P60 family protein [Pseudonocardia halophobica]|uniref:NlpC/P60 family protein n=1 Tax=Pseudonocardia halophobica TaxID=29401 RepID=UPI003D92ABDD